jgi:acetyl-CoA acyltransferase
VSDAYLYAGVRTPFGRFGGALAGSRPDDLAAHVVGAVVERAPGLDPAAVDDVLLGCANGAGEDNRNVARMAVLLAGLPVSVPGVTVNRLCGSSLQAAMDASRLVETGDATVVVAGGVESMTRAPWVLPKPSRAFPAGNETLVSTTLGWRLVNERMPAEWTVSLGECNEQLADSLGIGRDRQDEFAALSHQRAARAWSDGFYDDLVVPVDGLTRDEGVRPDASPESLACLDAWKVDPDLVNTRGGAIAIGHPLGASGARVLATLAKVLVERRERWGVAAICIGVGQGLAVVLENVAA